MWREDRTKSYRMPVISARSDTVVYAPKPGRPEWVFFGPGELRWAPVPGAEYYIVEKRVSGTLYEEVVTVTSPELVSPAVTGPAFWRVRAGNANGKGPSSNPVWIE